MNGDHVAVLVAELELEQAVLQRLETRRPAERVPERRVFERRERRQHAPRAEQLFLQPRDARQHLERGVEIVAAHALEHVVELVQEQPHPQFGHLVDDDEQHLVLLDGIGLLCVEQLVELQVFAIGLGSAQVPVHAFVLEIDFVVGHRVPNLLRRRPIAARGASPARARDRARASRRNDVPPPARIAPSGSCASRA